jgi:hypothetical protein
MTLRPCAVSIQRAESASILLGWLTLVLAALSLQGMTTAGDAAGGLTLALHILAVIAWAGQLLLSVRRNRVSKEVPIQVSALPCPSSIDSKESELTLVANKMPLTNKARSVV